MNQCCKFEKLINISFKIIFQYERVDFCKLLAVDVSVMWPKGCEVILLIETVPAAELTWIVPPWPTTNTQHLLWLDGKPFRTGFQMGNMTVGRRKGS